MGWPLRKTADLWNGLYLGPEEIAELLQTVRQHQTSDVAFLLHAIDLAPLNESASGARILVLGRNRRRSDNATREEVFCGADHRQAA